MQGVKQRWFLVHSEAKVAQEQRALEKKIEREAETLQKQLKRLKKQGFDCEEDTRRAGRELETKLKYHRFSSLGSRLLKAV
jgi:transposase